MKKNLIKASAFGIATILLGSPLVTVAAAWDHSTGSQGTDGTLWATLPGTVNDNDASLNLTNAECGIGFHQSPIAINLTTATIKTNPGSGAKTDNNPPAIVEKHSTPVIPQYPSSVSSTKGAGVSTDASNAYVFENSGHAVQIAFSKGYPGKLRVGNDSYPLVQFHFHTPSEHLVQTDANPSGKQYAGELHFVHQRADGKVAVLTIFLDDTGAFNPTLDKILGNSPQSPAPGDIASFNGGLGVTTFNSTTGNKIPLDPMALIPKGNQQVFTYAGSLTTPPCSEGVNWYILSEPLKVSPKQISALGLFYTGSNRITQNTNYSGSNFPRIVEIHKSFNVDFDHGRDFDSRN